MTIDPLETIILWLKDNLTGVYGRVASKNQYGNAWETKETGLAVYMDDGMSALYGTTSTVRLEMRIYADGRPLATDVWRALVDLGREHKRFNVQTSQGVALVHYFQQSSGLSFLYDDDLKMDVGVVFFESMVSEEAIV